MQYVILKKLRFIKEKEASESLSNWRVTTLLSQIPLVRPLFKDTKMNKIVNKFLLAEINSYLR